MQQFALAHHGVGEVQAVELNLAWAVFVDSVASKNVGEIVVERTVRHELQCADRVGHALEVVALAMCEVIHWVYFPLGAGAPVWGLDNAVHDGIAEMHVA